MVEVLPNLKTSEPWSFAEAKRVTPEKKSGREQKLRNDEKDSAELNRIIDPEGQMIQYASMSEIA